MRTLFYFVSAAIVVAGQQQKKQYKTYSNTVLPQDREKLETKYQHRELLKNVFAIMQEPSTDIQKQRGFGEGINRKGLNKVMSINGMGQIGGMGEMGAMAGMGALRNTTIQMMRAMKTPEPTSVASNSPSPSQSPSPTIAPIFDRVSFALVVPGLTKEPTDLEYMNLIESITTYFESTLKMPILETYKVTLDNITFSNELNLFNKGIPDERFNILMNYDVSASYSNGSISDEALFTVMRDYISAELITEVIRKIAPFETTNEILFRPNGLLS